MLSKSCRSKGQKEEHPSHLRQNKTPNLPAPNPQLLALAGFLGKFGRLLPGSEGTVAPQVTPNLGMVPPEPGMSGTVRIPGQQHRWENTDPGAGKSQDKSISWQRKSQVRNIPGQEYPRAAASQRNKNPRAALWSKTIPGRRKSQGKENPRERKSQSSISVQGTSRSGNIPEQEQPKPMEFPRQQYPGQRKSQIEENPRAKKNPGAPFQC